MKNERANSKLWKNFYKAAQLKAAGHGGSAKREKRTVSHDVRKNNRIFLIIDAPKGDIDSREWQIEVSKKAYSVERELDQNNDSPETLMALIAEMESESGFELECSDTLKEVFEL